MGWKGVEKNKSTNPSFKKKKKKINFRINGFIPFFWCMIHVLTSLLLTYLVIVEFLSLVLYRTNLSLSAVLQLLLQKQNSFFLLRAVTCDNKNVLALCKFLFYKKKTASKKIVMVSFAQNPVALHKASILVFSNLVNALKSFKKGYYINK